MDRKEQEFRARLLAIFKVEAEEHISALTAGLITLENSTDPEERVACIENVFREAHSLKGAARSVNDTAIEQLCHGLETLFAAMKRQDIALSPPLFDTLHDAADLLHDLLAESGRAGPNPEQARLNHLMARLEALSKAGEAPGTPPEIVAEAPEQTPGAAPERLEDAPGAVPPPPRAPVAAERPTPVRAATTATDTVRIPATRLDALLVQTEELLSARLAARQRAAEVQEISRTLAAWRREWFARASDARALQRALAGGGRQGELWEQQLGNVLEFVEQAENDIRELTRQIAILERRAGQSEHALGSMVDTLRDDMKRALMLPFSSLLEPFPKLVRDLARDHGKEAHLLASGAEIEVDRRILEAIRDPLLHILRNSIDHGIEPPEVRERQGKPARGTISITIAPRNSREMEIAISDDGQGIEIERLAATARSLGMLAPDAEPPDEQAALALIFQSGFTTSPAVTDLSGRGLGLAIVREKVEALRGTVTVTTTRGRGSTFRLVLPLSLATFHGLFVRVGQQRFVIPLPSVERALRVRRDEVRRIENRPTIRHEGRHLPLADLGEVLGVPRGDPAEQGETLQVIVLTTVERRVAFVVDELLREQEVLVKGLGPQLARVRNIAGATILGSGQVVPVLNVTDLMKSALRAGQAPTDHGETLDTERATERRAILVAEDSITARTLLKSILEGAGYRVATATDGLDAFTQLRGGHFDLVVSDVDMPGMDGFTLTAKIRADKKLADLPVILVTALDSAGDRERGIDVGASAYIVKSSFDQSNLLEAIERLIY